ncbi:EMB2076 [Symbiodinium necroappetens]|uniref:EMB2076 protein n=1 Tax=Symbiodinium necroappetens TaxID=1628268 RepID=A0A812K5B2_9DINO|nr:EMB2076 [Symbiodinium necroappetens]
MLPRRCWPQPAADSAAWRGLRPAVAGAQAAYWAIWHNSVPARLADVRCDTDTPLSTSPGSGMLGAVNWLYLELGAMVRSRGAASSNASAALASFALRAQACSLLALPIAGPPGHVTRLMGGLDQVRLEAAKECGDGYVLEPPESIDAAVVYKLYRGATGEVNGQAQRVWVDFPSLHLSWAPYDTPAQKQCRLSLLDVASCTATSASSEKGHGDVLCMELWGHPPVRSTREAERAGGSFGICQRDTLLLAVEATAYAMQGFAESLENLLASRDKEGKSKLEFIQRSLFQYLWRHQGVRLAENSEQALYEAQAVLAFNLDPKEGVKYLKGKLGKSSSLEVGQWLAQMSTVNGGLDPTLLGNFFSRRDSLEVFREFVNCLDFAGMNLVVALRNFDGMLFQLRAISSRRILKSRLVQATGAISEARRSRQWRQSLQLFTDYMAAAHADQLLIEMPIYNAAITACEVGSRWVEALALLQSAEGSGLVPTVVSLTAAMSACREGRQWKRALEIFSRADQEVKVDEALLGAAIASAASWQRWELALQILASAPEYRVLPNLPMRNAGLLACEKGRQWELALSMLQWSQASLITVNSTLSACEKARQWEQALALFAALPGRLPRPLEPDSVTWTVAIGAMAAGRFWQAALRSFWELCRSEEASYTMHTTALSACERALRWEDALQLLELWPSPSGSTELASIAAARSSNWRYALSLALESGHFARHHAAQCLEGAGCWGHAGQCLPNSESILAIRRLKVFLPEPGMAESSLQGFGDQLKWLVHPGTAASNALWTVTSRDFHEASGITILSGVMRSSRSVRGQKGSAGVLCSVLLEMINSAGVLGKPVAKHSGRRVPDCTSHSFALSQRL